jgi:hypothetical protein
VHALPADINQPARRLEAAASGRLSELLICSASEGNGHDHSRDTHAEG